MNKDCIYIDLDGVILDSEERMLERKEKLGFHNHKSKKEFEEFFNYTNLHPEEWDYIIREASSINNATEIIRELESLKKKIAILTKIHTLYEMRVKVEDLRTNRKINCPVYFVPPGVKKHNIIIPNGHLLVDDSEKNIKLWKENGGKGLIFDRTIPYETNERIKSLVFLLKR